MRRDLPFVMLAVLLGSPPMFAATVRSETQAPSPKASDAPLSKKLDEDKGVIKPPHGVDPEIHRDPPATTGDKMPVIIPPGEPGGDQSVQPK